MTPRTLKAIMISNYGKKKSVNVKWLKKNRQALIFANHSLDDQKQFVLANYIHQNQKTLSPTVFKFKSEEHLEEFFPGSGYMRHRIHSQFDKLNLPSEHSHQILKESALQLPVKVSF